MVIFLSQSNLLESMVQEEEIPVVARILSLGVGFSTPEADSSALILLPQAHSLCHAGFRMHISIHETYLLSLNTRIKCSVAKQAERTRLYTQYPREQSSLESFT